MLCLQCGKSIPLLKRMAGSEFCSEAHRRDYQHEYSQLALGRLLQSDPAESLAQALKAPQLATASAPAVDNSPAAIALNGAPAATKPRVAPEWAETAHSAATQSMRAETPNGIGKPHASPAISATTVAEEPATAKLAVFPKPAPAALSFALLAAPEFEHAFASTGPDRPRSQSDLLPTELLHARAIALESHVEVADSLARPIEHKLDLRQVSLPVPKITLDLQVVPPESLHAENRPIAIPVAPARPAEVSPWIGPYRDFARALVSLSGFANDQFSKSGFEAPALAGGSVVSAVRESLPPELQPAAVESEPPQEETAASIPTAPVPDPELNPLPVSSTGMAPARTKPVPVFGPAPISTGSIQIPQPNGLPLRPVMVLSTAASAAPPYPGAKSRKQDVLGLRSAFPTAPTLEESKTSAPFSPALNLGLPELRMETPAGASGPRMRAILAAAAGAILLGVAILSFVSKPFVSKPGDAGSKPPAQVLAADATSSQWIANFAPDAQRQRRVSVLRSSMNLSDYRLDFESSIRIKALGWVYRVRDAKNFYVGKIEFQKPGVNPVYALVHYAVINGVEQPRVETPLHVSVPMGGVYKIRFEAAGSRFITWVQGQQVEQWTEPRLSSGGAGLYAEGVEQSILHGDFVVTPLSK